MLLTAFTFGFITGGVATIYWFIHGFVFGAIERIEENDP